MVAPWQSWDGGTGLKEEEAAAAADAAADMVANLAAQSLLTARSPLHARFWRRRVLAVGSMSRVNVTSACLYHSGRGEETETGNEMRSESSFAAAVGCGFLFVRGWETVTRCSSSGFASATAGVFWWPDVTSLVLTSASGWDSGTDCLSAKSLAGPFALHLGPSRLPCTVVPSSSHKSSWTSRSKSRRRRCPLARRAR